MLQVFLDTETTGIETGACVIELAAIMVEDNEIIDIFHQYAKPYRPINPAAQAAHGITEELLSDKPEEKEMLKDFIEWVEGAGEVREIFAYNAQFDIRVINDRIKMDFLRENNFFDKYKIIDVAKYAKLAIKNGVIPKNGRKWNQDTNRSASDRSEGGGFLSKSGAGEESTQTIQRRCRLSALQCIKAGKREKY